MNGMVLGLVLVVSVVCIGLDLARKINRMRGVPLTVFLLLALNLPFWLEWANLGLLRESSPLGRGIAYLVLGVPVLYLALRLSFFPVLDGKGVSLRLNVMIGGRFLVYRALWAMVVETVFLLATFHGFRVVGMADRTLWVNLVWGAVWTLLLLGGGILRIFLTSRRLSIVRRVVMVLTMWIPLVNLAVLGYACRLVRDEYDFALYKKDLHLTRPESDLCATKYPLIMVHGVLFRDLKYFNYWGRIPKELMRYGATVYYGNQEAVGTIEYNGEDIRRKILQVLEETGCEKVNIIAHSKGGLDARYAIGALGMGDRVASLTTMNTPHRGCRFVDWACRLLPEGVLRFLDRVVNNTFRKFGDENPDFYTAVHQFTTENSARFNERVTDAPGVYYQSFMSRMRSFISDSLLAVPYLIIKPLEGQNDGLVALESGKWGEFRGVLTSKSRRGISHGDIIDLKREDYKGFDVVETYVGIVAELRRMGY